MARPDPARAGVVLVAAGAAFLAGAYGSRLAGTAGGSSGPYLLLAAVLVPVFLAAVVVDPRLAVLAVVAVFPIGSRKSPLPIELVQSVTLAAAALVVVPRLVRPIPWLRWHRALAGAAVLLVWITAVAPFALASRHTNRAVVGLGVNLLLAVAILTVCPRTRDVRFVLAGFVAVAAGVGLTTPSGASQVQAYYGGSVISGRAVGIFTDPNQLGTFCGAGTLLALTLAIGARTRTGRVAAAAASVSCLVGLALSLSRGAWIGFFAGLVVFALAVAEARRVVVALAVPLVVAVATFGAFAPSSPQVQVVGARLKSIAGEKNPYDARPAIWAEARRIIVAHPITGAGPGSFPEVSVRTTSDARATYVDHAHDILLTWGAEDGLPADLIIIAFGVTLGVTASRARRRASRQGRRADAVLAAGLGAALAAVAAQGIVDYTLTNSVVYATVFLEIGCLVAAEAAIRRSAPAGAAGGAAGGDLLPAGVGRGRA